jgi:predicted ester cyclase
MMIRTNIKEAPMSVEQNKRLAIRVFTEAFNEGRLEVIDETVAADGVDHQHPNEPSFRQHLKEVVKAMRTAFPDLRFEVTEMIGEGEWIAVHTIMTGTNTGELRRPLMLPPTAPAAVPATGRSVRVAHMHMIRWVDGRSTDLWHVMDTMAMAGQLGLLPAGNRVPAAE